MRLLQSLTTLSISLTRKLSVSSRSMSVEIAHPAGVETILKSVFNSSGSRNIFSFHATGGGAEFIHWVFTTPGASNSVLEGTVPYSRESLLRTVNHYSYDPNFTGACTGETSVDMAKAAYISSVNSLLTSGSDLSVISSANIFGVSCTAALVSDRLKKGAHRCHVAVYSNKGSTSYSLELDKTLGRSRLQEDRICSRLLLDAVATQCGVELTSGSVLSNNSENSNEKTILRVTEQVIISHSHHTASDDAISQVSNRQITHALFVPKPHNEGITNNTNNALNDHFSIFPSPLIPINSIIYPGSFNPLHIGHVGIVTGAVELLAKRMTNDTPSGSNTNNDNINSPLVIFELAVVNADKPSLPQVEIEKRLMQFVMDTQNAQLLRGLRCAVCITSEPLFVGKSNIFKGSQFVIGSDTFVRLIDSKYYKPKQLSQQSDTAQQVDLKALLNMTAALTTIQNNKCSIVVGGRVKQLGVVKTVVDANSVTSPLNPTTLVTSSSTTFETLTSLLRDSPVASLLPVEVLALFVEMKETDFRMDISSTELRHKMTSTSVGVAAGGVTEWCK